MAINRIYSTGSIIYFEGDVGEEIYVLKSGKVTLISTAADTGEEVREDVQLGEFFGVKSSLGHFPREETAQALAKTEVIMFKGPEFEKFIIKNTRLIVKMLKVFSRQLRNIHRQIRNLLKAGAVKDPRYELMNVAESFYRAGNFDHAEYAFHRFLELYEGSAYEDRARDLLKKAKDKQMYPPGYPPLEELETESYKGSTGGESDSGEPSGTKMADFFYQAMDLYSQNKFDDAIRLYQQCLALENVTAKQDINLQIRSLFEMGRCEFRLKRLDDAAKTFSGYAKQHPGGENLKDAVLFLAEIAEITGDRDRAKNLYHRVATLPPADDKATIEARKRLQKIS